MAAPGSPPPTRSLAGGLAGAVQMPDDSMGALLSASRSLALVLSILAGLLFLIFLGLTVLDVVLGRGAGALFLSVYCVASAAVNFVIWREMPALERLAAAREYAVLRQHLLIWAVLGLIFFVVVGVLLLIAWLKAELLATAPAPS